MASAVSLVALLGACSYQWGAPEPALMLTGTPPPLSSLVKLNVLPAGPAAVLAGAGGVPWAAFCEYRGGNTGATSGSFRNCRRLHLSRLAGTAADEVLLSDGFVVRRGAIYRLDPGSTEGQRRITVHRPGDPPALDATFEVPTGPAILYTNDGGDNDIFAYWVLDAATTSWDVFRRDRLHRLTLPVPDGVDPADPGASMDFLFTADGSTLVVSGPDQVITAWSTLDGTAREIDRRPGTMFVDNVRAALLVVGVDFRSLPLDGGAPTVLSRHPFEPVTLAGDELGNAWYRWKGGLYRVPLDGGAEPERVVDVAERLLAVLPDGRPIYSRDPEERYINGAGDAWLGDRRLVERGFFSCLSDRRGRLYGLEHAATTNAVGTLVGMPLDPGEPTAPEPATTLGLNVSTWACMSNGSLLVIENQAMRGPWNRLVSIDWGAESGSGAAGGGTARFLLDAAVNFEVVPGERELVVDVVSGASGYDIVRLPLR